MERANFLSSPGSGRGNLVLPGETPAPAAQRMGAPRNAGQRTASPLAGRLARGAPCARGRGRSGTTNPMNLPWAAASLRRNQERLARPTRVRNPPRQRGRWLAAVRGRNNPERRIPRNGRAGGGCPAWGPQHRRSGFGRPFPRSNHEALPGREVSAAAPRNGLVPGRAVRAGNLGGWFAEQSSSLPEPRGREDMTRLDPRAPGADRQGI